MEPKKINKFEIKSETISNLSKPQQSQLIGGGFLSFLLTNCPDVIHCIEDMGTSVKWPNDPNCPVGYVYPNTVGCGTGMGHTCDLEVDGCRTATNYGDASCFPPFCSP